MKFFIAPNLATTDVTESEPWNFSADSTHLRSIPKTRRRELLKLPTTQWQVYSPVRGVHSGVIVSTDNPPAAVRGFVADYDAQQSVESICQLIEQIAPAFRPTYLESTLGGKARLVWEFEDELPVVDGAYLSRLWRELADRGKWKTALAGFDENSFKPAERWTNGGIWYDLGTGKLGRDIVYGCAVEAGKSRDSHRQEVPLEAIAEEVGKRWPGRWQGEFKLDAVGVRFWDPTADAPTGCQVKPDGMLCFTGPVGFQPWREILGHEWFDEQATLNMGRAVEGIWFDGRGYWKQAGDRWFYFARTDILTHLAARGLNPTRAKGQLLADAETALVHIQDRQRVGGAAPLINEKPGVVELRGQLFLNTSCLKPVKRSGRANVSPEHFPWTWNFLIHLFPEELALWTFLAWLKRGYISLTQFRRYMGQVLFLCGPKNSGKTLLAVRIIAPILGGIYRNPYDYFVGNTAFTDELFGAGLWAINDEDAPANEAQRQKFIARIKSASVNPEHTYHPKFQQKFLVSWQGRMVVTLNDDIAAVGILPELNSNTEDKLMFLRALSYQGSFPPNHVLEPIIAAELPDFVEWVMEWDEPEDVLADNRMGVKSYFDPDILAMARHQAASHNLSELLVKWQQASSEWENKEEWQGNATDLLTDISLCDPLRRLADEWKVFTLAKRLVELAKIPGSGVTQPDGASRYFKITRITH